MFFFHCTYTSNKKLAAVFNYLWIFSYFRGVTLESNFSDIGYQLAWTLKIQKFLRVHLVSGPKAIQKLYIKLH